MELNKSVKADERNQFNSFRETIEKVMNENKMLGEKIKTIFREQGITIVSILSALGTVIAAIVGRVFKGGAASTTAASGGGSCGGGSDGRGSGEDGWVRNWVKKQLSAL